MAEFDIEIRHWPTISAFAAYLQGVPRPKWCKRITNHNTYRPNEFQWAGQRSMESMKKTYIDKGWTSGPNLYLCAKAPNPADQGIWQMTPITRPGTHAGACNADSLGVEWVGDFDARPPSADQYTLGITINILIMHHWGIPPSSVNVHNECMTGRTCPGKYLTGTQIRADLQKKPLPIPAPSRRPYRMIAPCAPLTARSPSAPLAAGVVFAVDDIVNVGAEGTQDGWLWVSDRPDTAPGIGWIPSAYARPV